MLFQPVQISCIDGMKVRTLKTLNHNSRRALSPFDEDHRSIHHGHDEDCTCFFSLCWITPVSTRWGISVASHGPNPKHRACAIPNLGQFFAHSGLKWIVKQIFPPLSEGWECCSTHYKLNCVFKSVVYCDCEYNHFLNSSVVSSSSRVNTWRRNWSKHSKELHCRPLIKVEI